jgi:hypothetical protein
MNLIPVGHGVVEQIGFKLRLRGIIPEEEKNDSYIIAEAAVLGCSILLSFDVHMLEAQENDALRRCLADCDVEGHDLAIAGLDGGTEIYPEDSAEGPNVKLPVPRRGLVRIVGVETEDALPLSSCPGGSAASHATGGPELDILFSKPANQEQYEIAARLEMSNAVLVQGPPGTGKTHTIANLLGYMLAQGKTVLVTAHTTKALRVLRGQLDEALQPLCLSVLDNDVESQAQLSHAAQEIASRLSRSDASSLRREAAILRAERQKMLKNAATLRQQLRDARFSEIDEIVLGGEGTSPIEATFVAFVNLCQSAPSFP